jgi:hypothetical protein
MDSAAPLRTPRRPLRAPVLVVVGLLVAAVAGVRVSQSLGWSSPTTAGPARVLHGEHRGPLGEADGAVPDGTSVFDDQVPAVANLDPQLLDALRRAAHDAADRGVGFVVDSGWRSRAYQEQLLRDAVSEYGSESAAARWVASPDASAHVTGDAIDIGPSSATSWLSRHGAAYGLCPVYANEPWHYELRPDARAHGCPAMYADAAHDPRAQ